MCTLWWAGVSKDVPRINTIAAKGVGRASKLCNFDFCLNRGIWSISSRAVPNSPTNIARTCYMNGWYPNPHCQLGWVWAEWLESVLLERRWHHHSARHHPLDNQVACGCWTFFCCCCGCCCCRCCCYMHEMCAKDFSTKVKTRYIKHILKKQQYEKQGLWFCHEGH